MTRIFDENGDAIPVTLLSVGPCVVVRLKHLEKMAMMQFKLGYGVRKSKHLNKPMEGHLKKHNVKPPRYLVEFNIVPGYDYKLGSIFHVGLFSSG